MRYTFIIMALAFIIGCENKTVKVTEPEMLPVNTNDVAVIETKHGKMIAEFFHKDAPKTVANFQTLAKKGFYDGTTFHRLVRSFMVQGGDPLSKDPKNLDLGSGGPGYSIKAEFNNQPHRLGTLSMARSSHPDSAGSQFFICLNRCADLDNQYTAFGKLITGTNVLKQIGSLPTKMNPYSQEKSTPEERLVIERITIVPREEALK